MKKIKEIIPLIFIFSLTSCSLENILSLLIVDESNYEVKTGTCDIDNTTGLDFLNIAFNGNNKTNELKKVFKEYKNDENLDYYTFEYNNSNLKYFDGYMPTTGNVNALVIPINFKDYPIDSNYDFPSEFDFLPVSTYYYNSSYGKLNLSFDIMNWYTPYYNSYHYKYLKHYYEGSSKGTSQLIDEALTYYTENDMIDLSKYDSNGDDVIDAIYLIYSRPYSNYENEDFWWAYQYYYFEENTYDGYNPYCYIFASIDFFLNKDDLITTDTIIHETGHLLGLEDYYDYDTEQGKTNGGTGSADMMDYDSGDHNAFSKILLGWIDKAIIIDKEMEFNLPYIQDYPICAIIGDFDKDKSIYQSMYLLENYNVNDVLNSNTYYDKGSGLRLIHINAELSSNDLEDENNYFTYDNSYSNKNLIDFIKNTKNGVGKLYSKSDEYIEASGSDLILSGKTLNSLYFDKNFEYNISYKHLVNNDQYKVIITLD